MPYDMRAIVVRNPGTPEVLRLERKPIPELRKGWSLVRIHARGLNHSEIFTRKGLSPSVRFPRVLGIECVGEIASTTDPLRLPIGKKVVSMMGEMGRDFDGSYADYALLPNVQIYPVESSLPWEILAAIPETCYTAYGSMLNMRIAPGQKVLVRGATSSVGIAFARLVRAIAPDVYLVGSTRSPSRESLLIQHGFDEAALDADGDLQVEGRAFDSALDLVGPAALKNTCAHVKAGGIVCSTGQLGNRWFMDDFDPITDLPPNGFLTSFYSGNVQGNTLAKLIAFIEKNAVDITPEKVFTLDQMADAHRYLEGQHCFGKVVVKE